MLLGCCTTNRNHTSYAARVIRRRFLFCIFRLFFPLFPLSSAIPSFFIFFFFSPVFCSLRFGSKYWCTCLSRFGNKSWKNFAHGFRSRCISHTAISTDACVARATAQSMARCEIFGIKCTMHVVHHVQLRAKMQLHLLAKRGVARVVVAVHLPCRVETDLAMQNYFEGSNSFG